MNLIVVLRTFNTKWNKVRKLVAEPVTEEDEVIKALNSAQ